VENRKTTVLIGEDGREIRSLLCDKFCGTGICCVKRGRGMETKYSGRYCNLCRI